ncbi:Methyltransferase domain protein [Maioricimonas rarisocia]|uniref:Methyltransferase domain protein n=1 Tax=Maioricimonas rarisocia TaxID=2528026 RepID=A0A517Z8Y4_9PLAN|nr:class I SAM-dependent methyltransferase [Maioricimonas rarisocia]QDU38947.1 Methyltransferase domain protein [Maioricimonas rarisocia]
MSGQRAISGAEAGQAVYTPRVLRIYDLLVHGVSNPWIWRCPTPKLVELYDRCASGRHLDVGVGTGYFLDRCRFPVEQPEIVLMDLNEDCLEAAAERIRRYGPTTVHCDVLEPVPDDLGRFDSIGLMYLLHCLPGTIEEKACVFDHLKPLLASGGCLFGATLLSEGVRRGVAARYLMSAYNRKQIFTNQADSLDGLRTALESRFSNVEIQTTGCAALFVART